MKLSWTAFGLLAIIAIAHYLGTIFDWYYYADFFDEPMHLAGGAFIGMMFVYLFLERTSHARLLPAWAYLLFGLGFIALVGIFWEFYEFLADLFITHKYTLSTFPSAVHVDTLKDLMNDLLGGAVGLLLAKKLARHPTTE